MDALGATRLAVIGTDDSAAARRTQLTTVTLGDPGLLDADRRPPARRRSRATSDDRTPITERPRSRFRAYHWAAVTRAVTLSIRDALQRDEPPRMGRLTLHDRHGRRAETSLRAELAASLHGDIHCLARFRLVRIRCAGERIRVQVRARASRSPSPTSPPRRPSDGKREWCFSVQGLDETVQAARFATRREAEKAHRRFKRAIELLGRTRLSSFFDRINDPALASAGCRSPAAVCAALCLPALLAFPAAAERRAVQGPGDHRARSPTRPRSRERRRTTPPATGASASR